MVPIPQYTIPTPPKPEPVTETTVPPASTPRVGVTELTVNGVTALTETTLRLQTPSSPALPKPTCASAVPALPTKCEVHFTSAEDTNVASTASLPNRQRAFALINPDPIMYTTVEISF